MVWAVEPILRPKRLHHLPLCPESPTSCPSLNRGTCVGTALGAPPPLQGLPAPPQRPSACAWQLPPRWDGGALAGSSLWESHHSPLCLYRDGQTDARIQPLTHTFIPWTDTCPPPHQSGLDPALSIAIQSPKLVSFQPRYFYIPGSVWSTQVSPCP